MELLEYWKIIRKRLLLICWLMVLGGSLAYYWSSQQPPLYRATTTLFLNPSAVTPLLGFQIDTSNRAQSLANTYAEFMQTQAFAHLVANEMEGRVTAGDVLDSVTTAYEGGSQFFQIRATWTNPEVAQELANTAAMVFIAENRARREQLDAQRTAVVTERLDRLDQLRAALQDELVFYTAQIQSLPSEIADLQAQPQTPEILTQIQLLRNELKDFRALRVDVLGSLLQLQTIQIDDQLPNVETAVVLDRAALPITPLSRKTVELTLIAIAASLAVGLGLAFLLEYLDYSIKSAEVLEIVYGLPAQGVIGILSRKLRGKKPSQLLVTARAPLSSFAEAFRALRTRMLVPSVRSVLVTSAKPGEGKTFIAANLAVSFAKNGQRVILVDTDLRRPTLHQMFDLTRVPGFTNLVLRQHAEVKDFLQSTSIRNLQLLPSGTVPTNPAEILSSPRAAQVMQELAELADIVIYDSAPTLMVTDATVIASRVDGVMQVVHATRTNVGQVLRCKSVLEQVGARILGPVLNRVEEGDLVTNASYYEYHPGNGHAREPIYSMRQVLPRRRRQQKIVDAAVDTD